MTRQAKQILKKATGGYLTQKEAVTTISSGDKLIAIIYKDMNSKKTLMFSCKEMDADDIADMMSKVTAPQETVHFKRFPNLPLGMEDRGNGTCFVIDHEHKAIEKKQFVGTVDDYKPDEE